MVGLPSVHMEWVLMDYPTALSVAFFCSLVMGFMVKTVARLMMAAYQGKDSVMRE